MNKRNYRDRTGPVRFRDFLICKATLVTDGVSIGIDYQKAGGLGVVYFKSE